MRLKEMRKAYRDVHNAGWNRLGRRYVVSYTCRCVQIFMQIRQVLLYCGIHGTEHDGVHCEFRDNDVI